MRNRIIYGIIKTYKGIFSKTHIGNVQIIIIEMNKKFWILNMIGQMENGNHVGQMLLSAPSQYIHVFLDDFEESENFIQMEELFCKIPKESEDSFNILLEKKGRYLSSNYTVSFSSEYSQGNIRIYEINGRFHPLMPDELKNKTQMKMKALKKQSIVTPLLNKFMSSIKGK